MLKIFLKLCRILEKAGDIIYRIDIKEGDEKINEY